MLEVSFSSETIIGLPATLDRADPLSQDRFMRCHQCGTAVSLESGERIEFRQTCLGCEADLHACLNCQHHDPLAHNECREPNAERVSDRARANRCEEFAPRTDSADSSATTDQAIADLEALFKN